MFDDIYNIFKVELDGEEFDSDDDALIAANLALNEIFAERDWKFLLKTQTLPAGTLSLAGITDLGKVIDVWAEGSEEPLKKATFQQRFDSTFDYWIDVPNNTLVLINDEYNNTNLVVDYKYKPDALTDSNTPITVDHLNALVAYRMGLQYFRKDQDTTIYNLLVDKEDSTMNLLIAYNESI